MSNTQDILDLGIASFEEGRLDEAIEIWREIAEDSSAAPLNISAAQIALGDRRSAVTTLETALDQDVTRPETFEHLGLILEQLDETERAVEVWELGRGKQQVTPTTLYNLGTVYARTGQIQEAIAAWQEARGSDIHQVYFNLGTALHQVGRTNEGIKVLQEAIQRRMSTPDIAYNLAEFLMDEKRFEEAHTVMLDSLTEHPTADSYNQLADYHLMRDESNAATKVLEMAYQKGHVNALVLYNLYKATKNMRYAEDLMQLADETCEDYIAFYLMGRIQEDTLGYDNLIPGFMQLMIEKMRENGHFTTEPDFRGRNIRRLGTVHEDDLTSTEIIIKAGQRSFDREVEIRDQLTTRLQQHPIKTPTYLAHFKQDDEHLYVMQVEKAELLTTLLRKGEIDETEYLRVMQAMAAVHAVMPAKGRKYDFKRRVRQVASSFDHKITRHLGPIIKTLREAKPYVFCNDSQSDNWMLKENGVVILDTQPKGRTPLASETAHLLGFLPFYTTAEGRAHAATVQLKMYQEECRNAGKTVTTPTEDTFVQQVCCGLIYRAMEKNLYYHKLGREADARTAIHVGMETARFMQDMFTQTDCDYGFIERRFDMALKRS